MGDHFDLFVLVFMWVLLFIARFVADKMMETANPKMRFFQGLGLWGLYTGFILSFVFCTYQSVLQNAKLGMEDLFKEVIIGLALINFALILVAIYYYVFWRKNHKISDIDKMKLKDL